MGGMIILFGVWLIIRTGQAWEILKGCSSLSEPHPFLASNLLFFLQDDPGIHYLDTLAFLVNQDRVGIRF